MASTPIVLGYVPISSVSVAVDEWDVQAEVDDPTERFSGFDIARSAIVFVDLRSSTTAPDSVGRYTISTIVQRTAAGARLRLKWAGTGVPVDPNEGAGHRGYLTAGSPRNGLAWHPSPRVIQVEVALIEAAKNVESFAIIDNFDNGNSAVADEMARGRQVRTLPTVRTFTRGQVVTMRPGAADLALPYDDTRLPGIAIALEMAPGGVIVQTGGLVTDLPFTLEPGREVFLSNTGGMTQDAASVVRPGKLQLLGVAVDSSSMIFSPPAYSVNRA